LNQNMLIGFSQRIRLEWLEEAAELVLSGKTERQIKEALEEMLLDKLSVESLAERGNRSKAITILMKIWATPPISLRILNQEGLKLLCELPVNEHLTIHWGMCMAVYPFFGLVAETVGHLLSLQEQVSIAQIQRRLRELLGERETVERATSRVVRCFVDWGVLKDSTAKGFYQAVNRRSISNAQIISWLVEAKLLANGSKTSILASIVQSPALYPFSFTEFIPAQLEQNQRLELFTQGYNQNVVALR
jgi:hypothetical protein